jgi:hypothetical protein
MEVVVIDFPGLSGVLKSLLHFLITGDRRHYAVIV